MLSGCSPGAHRPLSHGEGQPGGPVAPFHRTGPQARVGSLQWVCADHQELHPHLHWYKTWMVS